MSGPKRAEYHFVYDPTPKRLADLSRFTAQQVDRFEQQRGFLEEYLGNDVVISVCAAMDRVRECIETGLPNEGFEAYGSVWRTLDELQQKARQVRYERERAARLERQRVLEHQRLQQQRQRRFDMTLESMRECQRDWMNTRNQQLLKRWAQPSHYVSLHQTLAGLSEGPAETMETKVPSWRRAFEQLLDASNRAADENTSLLNMWQTELQRTMIELGGLNHSVLSRDQQEQYEQERKSLEQCAQAAYQTEEANLLQQVVADTVQLKHGAAKAIQQAEFEKASAIWRQALVTCGYTVEQRQQEDGTLVLQARSFPFKSLSLEVHQNKAEVLLNVTETGVKNRCVSDVQMLQAELGRHGMQMTVTDWGQGRPGYVEQIRNQQQTIRI